MTRGELAAAAEHDSFMLICTNHIKRLLTILLNVFKKLLKQIAF